MLISAEGLLRRSIYIAFAAGMVGVGFESAPALAQDTGSGTTQLQGVEVTGSHIRRVDTETADPVITLSRQYIQATGATTVGELITKLPNVAGGGQTTAVNNGGTGETTPALRGLTAVRTLMLLDGQRLLLTNLDAIPINMIERIEIVKDGASAVYGTDAIGGVVNIITRKHFTGFEATVGGGISDRGDGVKQQYTGTWGLSSSKGHVVAGVSYQNEDAIGTAKRKYSASALYQTYNGTQQQGGSGTGVNGRYFVPVANEPTGLNCNANSGQVQVALNNPSTAKPTNTSADFHCYGASPSDHFNYNGFNYDQLPEQRLEIFEESEWKIFDNVSFISSALFHDQNTRLQIAPEPLVPAQLTPPIGVAADNYYNPFGVAISDARLRLSSLGDRLTAFDTTDYDVTSGFKGTLLDRFEWDVLATYQRETLLTTNSGQVYLPGLAPALGPSINQTTCGNATTGSISNCVPFNIFGVPTAAQTGALFPTDYVNKISRQTLVNADINGDLFTWYAGAVSAAAGYAYRALSLSNQPDFLEANSLVTDFAGAATQGSYSANEAYAEVTIPLANKLPGAYSLNLDVGGRFSDYSTFGSKVNGKYSLEYRPIHDLLVRLSYADVYRIPTITNLYGGTLVNAAPTKDPCDGTNIHSAAAKNPACLGIVYDPAGANYTDEAADGQLNVNDPSNPNLAPEKGFTSSFGLVYNPEFYKPLTFNVDFWKYSIKQAIAQIKFQDSLDQCFEGVSELCSNFARNSLGNLATGTEPLTNAGHLLTSGVDFGVKLDFGQTRYGKFAASLDGSYLSQYRFQVNPTGPTVSLAGQFTPSSVTDQDGSGNFARLRMLGSLSWSQGPITATVINRFISNIIEYPGLNADALGPAATYCGSQSQTNLVIPPNAANGTSGGYVVCSRGVGSVDYTDLTASYVVKRINTELLVGVNNVFGKNAPLVYSGFNANTDSSTYDQIGRAYFARLKVSFK